MDQPPPPVGPQRHQTLAAILGLQPNEIDAYREYKLRDLRLSTRATNCLWKRRATDLSLVLSLSIEELLSIRNMGWHSVLEVLETVADLVLSGGGHRPPDAGVVRVTRAQPLGTGRPGSSEAGSVLAPGTPSIHSLDVLSWDVSLADMYNASWLPEKARGASVDLLDLDTRARNQLACLGVLTIEQLLCLTIRQLMAINGMGRIRVTRILDSLNGFIPSFQRDVRASDAVERESDRRSDLAGVQPGLGIQDSASLAAFVQDTVRQRRLTVDELTSTVAQQFHCTLSVARWALSDLAPVMLVGDEVLWVGECSLEDILASGKFSSFQTLVEHVLRRVSGERGAQVLASRCGLYGRRQTLAELANQLQLSRARVGQLTSRTVEPLRREERLCQLLLQPFEQAMSSLGDLGRLSTIGRVLARQLGDRWGSLEPEGYLRFVQQLSPDVEIWQGPREAMLFRKPTNAAAATRIAEKAETHLRRVGHPVTEDELSSLIRGWWRQVNPNVEPPTEYCCECLFTCREFVQVDGRWALAEWRWIQPRSVTQRIVAVLRDAGEPLDYGVIAERYRDTFGDIDDRSIYKLLSSSSRLFRRIARRVYGLSEWNYTA
jgi:RNA polymerase alpha subunit